MGPREVIVHPDAVVLAQAVAARLLTRLVDVQSVRRPAHVGVTGGTVGIEILAAVAASPLRDAVDWSGVHLWWGDERFLPDGDPERNETQARRALLDPLAGALPAGNVHPMLPSDAPGIASPEDSAAAYARELAAFTGGPDDGSGARVPAFDVLMFGMGPDGHVASLFPGHPALGAAGTSTVGVHGAPKPPPERVSFTFEAIRAAREVWVVAAGAAKSAAIAAALGGASVEQMPVVGAVGQERTLWLLDAAATPAA
ncbi:6-phosphogluconolactonase [Pengzhenrongella frigida]|uniref:6-phosphogluconolactonase n=1 Tax=Pengzhenrongella frigida TaxID=1259133 RepID=A0A4V1ZH56_9MICO|nr:6-phosphogluconolactonase [Cellulomonas sp. HLT2-17]RYV50874.1 6-phosphogluconolactonase [Cellulomonas sp. HLT2-17]